MCRSFLISVVVASWLLPDGLLGASPDAKVYDLAADFSAERNPSGPWVIGAFDHTFSRKPDELQNLSTCGKLTFAKTERGYSGGALLGWGSVSSGLLGLGSAATGVVKNIGESTVFSIPAGSVAIFPQNGPIVVRWIAPNDGRIDIRAKYVDLTNNAGVPEVWILHNRDFRTPLHYQRAYTSPEKPGGHFAPAAWSTGKESRYHGAVPVVENDTIDFVVDPMYTVCPGHSEHPDGNATDTIGLSAKINYSVERGFTD